MSGPSTALSPVIAASTHWLARAYPGGDSSTVAHTLAELQLRKRTGVNVIAFKHGDEVSTAIDPERKMAAGDVLVMIGPAGRLLDATDLLRGVEGVAVAVREG